MLVKEIAFCDFWAVLTRKRNKGTAVLLRENGNVDSDRYKTGSKSTR